MPIYNTTKSTIVLQLQLKQLCNLYIVHGGIHIFSLIPQIPSFIMHVTIFCYKNKPPI